ncbi:hypothetical protein B0H13DRAFT_2321669 [Mycena leptocephala]|nr:hypothetical protein B0H13DRAFT_2321669 [Mycena leptocephala]
MLVTTDDGGPGEVYHIMEKAPVSWGPILILENITSTLTLYLKVVEHEPALIEAARSERSKALTPENLGAALKALGYSPEKPRFSSRQAHYNTGELGEIHDIQPEETVEDPGESVGVGVEDEVFRQVYATLKAKKWPPPPGGYPFPKNDHVVTKLGKMPPGPCRLCGSEKHWNRECPNYVVYSEGLKRSANLSSVMEPTEEETMYQSLFTVLLNQTLTKASIDFGAMGGSFFESAVLKSKISERKATEKAVEAGDAVLAANIERKQDSAEIPRLDPNVEGEKVNSHTGKGSFDQDKCASTGKINPKVTLDEIPDEEEEKWRSMPKADLGVLEPVELEMSFETVETPAPKVTDWQSRKRARDARKFSKMAEDFWLNDGRMFGSQGGLEEELDSEEETEEEIQGDLEEAAETKETHFNSSSPRPSGKDGAAKLEQTFSEIPSDIVPIKLFKRRKTKPGRSALGTSVLSMKGTVGDINGSMIDLRVDTCADVTLISEELYQSLARPPPIRAGIPMRLVQLTHEEADIKGYVSVSIFVMTEEGSLIETEAEAYVVPGMSVPILLGEDYQLNYEIALTRKVESGTKLHFQGWQYTVRAQNVSRTNDLGRILFSNGTVNKHAKAKQHRSKLVRQKRIREKFGEEKRTVQLLTITKFVHMSVDLFF